MTALETAKQALYFLQRAIENEENKKTPADFEYDIWRAAEYLKTII